MPKFEVDIPHTLTPDEARKRIDRATAKIESSYGATCRWTEDHQLTVSRKGFDAVVSIEEERVHINVNLAFLLSPMATAIKTGLTRELSSLLKTPVDDATDPTATPV